MCLVYLFQLKHFLPLYSVVVLGAIIPTHIGVYLTIIQLVPPFPIVAKFP